MITNSIVKIGVNKLESTKKVDIINKTEISNKHEVDQLNSIQEFFYAPQSISYKLKFNLPSTKIYS
jgi:hypothetical protein